MSELSVEAGESLELWLGLPVFVQPVQILAQVMWRKDAFSGSMAMTELGISFEKLDKSVQKTIDEAVQRFVRLHQEAQEEEDASS